MKARDIALGGILVALTTIVLYATSILPISTLAILTIASALIPVCIIRSNIQTSIFVYISSILLYLEILSSILSTSSKKYL